MSARFIRVVEDLNGNMFGDQARIGVVEGAAFPTTGILDNFNRANEGPPPSASWGGPIFSGGPGCLVVSNEIKFNTGGDGTAYWGTSFNANQEAYVKIPATNYGGSSIINLFCRLQTPNTGGVDGYYVNYQASTGGTAIRRLDNESGSLVESLGNNILDSGDAWLGIKATGTTIEVWYKTTTAGTWTLLGDAEDVTYNSSGYIGIQTFEISLDDFGGGNS